MEETNYGRRSTFDVLNKIRELVKITPQGDILRYKITDFFNAKSRGEELSPAKEDEILYDLKKWGVIEIEERERLADEVVYYIKILPKFEEAYQEHKGIFIQLKEKKKDVPIPILYLNRDGDLWREPRDKYCYKMGGKSGRHGIMRYLATNKGYQETKEMSATLENKNKQSIRTEIAKIRDNISKFLKIDGEQVLEARKGSGYRINPKYKIHIDKE